MQTLSKEGFLLKMSAGGGWGPLLPFLLTQYPLWDRSGNSEKASSWVVSLRKGKKVGFVSCVPFPGYIFEADSSSFQDWEWSKRVGWGNFKQTVTVVYFLSFCILAVDGKYFGISRRIRAKKVETSGCVCANATPLLSTRCKKKVSYRDFSRNESQDKWHPSLVKGE